MIDRYNLSSRLPSHKGKEKAEGETAQIDNKWEESKEKRELGLKERKEKMILEARKWVHGVLRQLCIDWLLMYLRRMLEKQAKEQATN